MTLRTRKQLLHSSVRTRTHFAGMASAKGGIANFLGSGLLFDVDGLDGTASQ